MATLSRGVTQHVEQELCKLPVVLKLLPIQGDRLSSVITQGNGYKQHALKGQKLLTLGNGYKQHALKGQKLLAQGIALGIMAISNAPCKGKSFKYCL